ncbi:MAG: sulfatase [Opitutales bacterium]|nr:sulfatase [Opitutales bacterium]
MNIIYLHCHDAGRFVQPYDARMPTPHLGGFARQAVTFLDAHCAAPTCSPSRAALLTGQSAHETGMLGLTHRGFGLRDESQHLAVYLQQYGYETALAGVQHEWDLRRPESVRYSTKIPHAGRWDTLDPENDLRVAESVVQFLRERADTRPLFLSCGFHYPHRDFPAADPGYLGDAAVPSPLPDAPAVRADMAAYMTAVARMDDAFGRVWQELVDSGMAEDTFVFFTTDHGIAFPHMKCTLSAAGTGVALLMKPPARQAAPPRATAALVSHIDVFSTLCDYGRIPIPAWNQGKSLRPVLEGETDEHRREIFAEVTYHAGYEPKRSMRTPDFNYIRNFETAYHPAMANIDPGPTKTWMQVKGMLPYPVPPEELYDLAADPDERHNLANDPACAETLQTCRTRLDAWMRETEDPLLHGPVPAPPGARIEPPQ